jgi:RNA polymerase sigma-70 factor (ECF subfamily)
MTGTLIWPTPTLAVLAVRRGGRAGETGARLRLAAALAFEELVAREKERVFRVALSVLGPGCEAEAEDVTQEVFVRAYRSLPSFRGESRLSTWIYRLAFNLAVDHRRRLGRRREDGDPDRAEALPDSAPAGDPYRAARQDERSRAVRRALARVSEERRAVLHLHYWMGHTVAEIGELLGLPAGTVKSHLHRAREALREELEDRDI